MPQTSAFALSPRLFEKAKFHQRHNYSGAFVMCLGKVTVVCPNCRQPLRLVRPDSLHQYCTLEKPAEDEVNSDVIEQLYTCNNPLCGAKLKLYWYDVQMYLARA